MLWLSLVHSPLPDHTLMAKHLRSKDLVLIPGALLRQCIAISAQRRHLDGLPSAPSYRLTLGLLREAIKQLQFACPTHPTPEEGLAPLYEPEEPHEASIPTALVW